MEQNNFGKAPSADQIRAFASSPAGQQLIRALQQKKDQNLDAAARHAVSGNLSAAQNALGSLLSDPDIRALLKQFGG